MLCKHINIYFPCQIHQFRKLKIHFAKHAHYKLDLIQIHVIFLHLALNVVKIGQL